MNSNPACHADDFSGSLKAFVAVEPCDMRRSFNGLHNAVVNQLREEPKSGAIFAFINKRRSLLKILYWDGSGIWTLAKRLVRGTFAWPRSADVCRRQAETQCHRACPQSGAAASSFVNIRAIRGFEILRYFLTTDPSTLQL